MAIGGSIALMIYGIDLKRSLLKSDMDFTKPDIDGVDIKKAKKVRSQSADFDYCFEHNGFKMELAINPEIKSEVVLFNRQPYRVVLIEHIIEFKERYIERNGDTKHINDLKLIKEQIGKVTYGIRTHIHSL